MELGPLVKFVDSAHVLEEELHLFIKILRRLRLDKYRLLKCVKPQELFAEHLIDNSET